MDGARTGVFSARCRAIRASACEGAAGVVARSAHHLRCDDLPARVLIDKRGPALGPDEFRPSVNDRRKVSHGGTGWAVRRLRDIVQHRSIGAYVRLVANRSVHHRPALPSVLVAPAEDAAAQT